MHEEDRIRALELYSDIFDEAGNETAVLQLLVSPTRQAVNLARAYDARVRSAQEDGDTPAYLQVINQLRRQASQLAPEVPKADKDQLSLFEPAPAEEGGLDDLNLAPAAETTQSAPPARQPAEIGAFPDEDKDSADTPLPAPPAKAQEPDNAPGQDLDEFADAVEAFLADFKIKEEAVPAPAQEPDAEHDRAEGEAPAQGAGSADQPLPAQEPAMHAQTAVIPEQSAAQELQSRRVPVTELPELTVEALPPQPPLPRRHRKKKRPIVPLLILFIVFAIPLGLFGLGVLLSAALLSLSVALSLLCGAIIGFGAAFTAFSVFADILLVFGLSLVAAAFSLLFCWVFVWLLFAVMPGLVRGIIDLARKHCYKEVAI